MQRSLVIDRVAAQGESLAEWSHALGSWLGREDQSQVLKRDQATLVVAATLLGRAVVVKRWTLRGMSRLKSAMGAGRGVRHWNGAAWLARHTIPTARCLALAHDSLDGTRRDWLVMERLAGQSVLEMLAGGATSPRRELAVARALGEQIRHMIAHGRFNRDHKPSNLIVLEASDATPHIAVIDCVAILPTARAGGAGAAMERMLASLVIEPLGVNIPPRRSLMLASLLAAVGQDGARASARTLWRAVAARVAAHGDPVPRINPLAGG